MSSKKITFLLAMLALAVFACEGRQVHRTNTQTAQDAWQNTPSDSGTETREDGKDSGSAQEFDAEVPTTDAAKDSNATETKIDAAQSEDAAEPDTAQITDVAQPDAQPADTTEPTDAAHDKDTAEPDVAQCVDTNEPQDATENTDVAQYADIVATDATQGADAATPENADVAQYADIVATDATQGADAITPDIAQFFDAAEDGQESCENASVEVGINPADDADADVDACETYECSDAEEKADAGTDTDATANPDTTENTDVYVGEDANNDAADNTNNGEPTDAALDNNPDEGSPPALCCFSVYVNEAKGFSFEYPEEWTVVYDDEWTAVFDSMPEQYGNEENRIHVEIEYMPSGSEIGGYDEDFVEELQKSFFDNVACTAGQLKVNIFGTGEHFAIFAVAPLEQGNLAINMRYMYPKYEQIEWAKEIFAHLVLSLKTL